MIDPKELRIGNYVRSLKNNSNLCFGGNLPFWEVTIDDMLHIFNNQKNYEPIPLTEDWLFKFGFQNFGQTIVNENESYTRYVLHNIIGGCISYEVHLITSPYEGVPFYKIWFSIGNFDRQHIKDTGYVHNLQNHFWTVAGQELIYNENHK